MAATNSPLVSPDVVTRAARGAGLQMSQACRDRCRDYAEAYLRMVEEDRLLATGVREAKSPQEKAAIEAVRAKWHRPKAINVPATVASAVADLEKAYRATTGLMAKPDLAPERRQELTDMLIHYRAALIDVAVMAGQIQEAADDLATDHWPTPGALGVRRLDPFRCWVTWTAHAWREDGLRPTAGGVGKDRWRTSPFQGFIWELAKSLPGEPLDEASRAKFSERVRNVLRRA